MSYTVSAPSSASPASQAGKTGPASAPKTAGKTDKGFSFWDLVDIVNPLQHIPVVNNIYRNITGDEIGMVARIAGGALFGGVAGAAFGAANALMVHEKGADLGQMAMDTAGFSGKKPAKADEDLQVIEVRPVAKNAAKDHGIIWDDAPKAVAAAKPASVIHDKAPVQAAEKQDDKPVELAAALPSPQDLHALEPGIGSPDAVPVTASVPATAPAPELPKENIQQNMMQALAKYESMQRLGNIGGDIGKDKAEEKGFIAAQNGKKPFSGLVNIRRFN
ncbi:MAG: hypothetical protein JWM96_168 [Alphaproteobacteria bacterium]|nr:hypothetical protein [Alphaproteobacteria bacterium]